MIKYFTIYGERCSGTNFLEETIKANFNIEITWKYGWKHFFGFYDFKQTEKENDTLFIGIIREPINWLYSFYMNPHHVPKENLKLPDFLLNTFYSTMNADPNAPNPELLKEDLNYVTKDKYKNIFELRKYKNNYLMNILPKKVKNYLFIRYEDLSNYTEKVLTIISHKFNLEFKTDKIIKIDYYKTNKNKIFVPRKVEFSSEILKLIKKRLDLKQEKLLGYFI
jgi:hypothetical protein